MVFHSWQFAIFFAIVFIVYYLIPHRWRWSMLLVASYYFYMSWNPELIVLIAGVTAVTYVCARCIDGPSASRKLRKAMLALGIAVPLAVLFFFKYFNFFSQEVTVLLCTFSIPASPFSLKVILPIGISFYTFQALSYVIDVYRGDRPAEKHLGYYALYISFFPQLVAGPIERSGNLLPQLRAEHRFSYENAVDGIRLMALGFFKKLVVADYFAGFVDAYYANAMEQSGFAGAVATFLFAIQIYCDFSGYSDIAIGAARMMGIRLMQNFRAPYLSRSIKEFWRRWHISLSTWFSDYVYIPMGGSRVTLLRWVFNTMVVFLASGLWHGANWTFLIWGALHGLYMVIGRLTQPLRERMLPKNRSKGVSAVGSLLSVAGTFLLVCIGWGFFRAETVPEALHVFAHLLDGLQDGAFSYLRDGVVSLGCGLSVLIRIALSVLMLLIIDWKQGKTDLLAWLDKLPTPLRWTLYILFVSSIVMLTGKGAETATFIYFQF